MSNWISRLMVLCAALVFASGCEEEKKTVEVAENQPPEVEEVNLIPVNAMAGDTLTAYANAVDPEGDALELDYKWLVEGEDADGFPGETFPTGWLEEGAEVRVKVRAVEKGSGRKSDWKASNRVRVKKARGVKLGGVRIEPDTLYIFRPAKAVVDYGEHDPEEIENIYYQWSVNDQVVEGVTSARLDPSYFRRGAKVHVKACTDGRFSSDTTVHSMVHTVHNAPPSFTQPPSFHREDGKGHFTFQVDDPEGGEVSVKVQGGPPGMRAEGAGRIVVDLDKARPGTYSIVFKAVDDRGDSAVWRGSITIAAPGE